MEQNKQKEYQVYLDERKQLIEAERNTAQQFDKAILTLAAGALGLSIVFINQIAPQPISNSICYLTGAWILFCLSLLSTLISFLTSQAACRRQRDILDRDISGQSDNTNNKAASWTKWLNYFSIAIFILGVICLIIFSAVNLPKGR
jgi:magnesium-transporting ATPase (P-type)